MGRLVTIVWTDEIAGRARNDELMARNDELMARNDVSGHPGLDPGSGSSACINDFYVLRTL